MAKKPLPTVRPGDEKLGADTIMDRILAARHGVPYVHLAVFAIDVDRVRGWVDAARDPERLADETEGLPSVPEALQQAPFGWEVFLTEVYLLGWLDPRDEAQRSMVEDACLGILELARGASEEAPLGSQLPFAVYDAVRRGAWPQELMALFSTWKRRADPMARELAPLWADPTQHAARLAEACLDANIDPPLADPTLDGLTVMEAGELELGRATGSPPA